MADDAGHTRADLTAPPTETVEAGFFRLLAGLEGPGRRFGRAGRPGDEPARLGQRARLAGAPRDLAGMRPAPPHRPAEVEVEVLGLLGPEGAMPLHMTRWIMTRLSERWFAGGRDTASADTTFLDFCNMLQHRQLALFWRAWAEARPEVQLPFGQGGMTLALTDALAGIGLPGMQREDASPALKRRHATSLGQTVQGVERLTRLLADFVGAPVRLIEFVGHWMPIPPPLQTRLGQAHSRLGQGAVAGARSYQRQTRAELRIGPIDLPGFLRLADDLPFRARLADLVVFAAGREIDFDLRPVLAAPEVPAARIGASRLGRTAWIAPTGRREGDDLRLRSFTAMTEGAT